MLRIFAGIDAAEAPADERRCAAGAVDDPLDAAVDALDDVGRRAPVEAETPGIAAKARTPQVGAQRSGRPVAGQKNRQTHHRRGVAVGFWYGQQRAVADAESLDKPRRTPPQPPP